MAERSDPAPNALVVGAGDFIGAAIAKHFAAAGYTTAVGRRHEEKLALLDEPAVIAAALRESGLAADELLAPPAGVSMKQAARAMQGAR